MIREDGAGCEAAADVLVLRRRPESSVKLASSSSKLLLLYNLKDDWLEMTLHAVVVFRKHKVLAGLAIVVFVVEKAVIKKRRLDMM
jgi:hypothetical protein